MADRQVPFADERALTLLAEYWQAKRNGQIIPDRAAIDPLQLPPNYWPNILISEPVPATAAAPRRWRYRLVGSAHVDRYGTDFTGKTVDDIAQGSYQQYLNEIYATAFDRVLPVYSESVFRWNASGYASTRRLMLPISNGVPGQVAQILSVQVWPGKRDYDARSITELSRTGGFRDGFYTALDRDSFLPVE